MIIFPQKENYGIVHNHTPRRIEDLRPLNIVYPTGTGGQFIASLIVNDIQCVNDRNEYWKGGDGTAVATMHLHDLDNVGMNALMDRKTVFIEVDDSFETLRFIILLTEIKHHQPMSLKRLYTGYGNFHECNDAKSHKFQRDFLDMYKQHASPENYFCIDYHTFFIENNKKHISDFLTFVGLEDLPLYYDMIVSYNLRNQSLFDNIEKYMV